MQSYAVGLGADQGCQRIDPLEGTASRYHQEQHPISAWLPEDRPVGGYCKSLSLCVHLIHEKVARG